MTTTSPPVARSGLPRAVAAQLVLGGVLLAHLTVVEVTFLAAGTGKNAVLTVAKFFALHAATLMVLQILLIARLPWLDRRLGMDRLTRWHRWVGFTLLWTVATHATLVVLARRDVFVCGPTPMTDAVLRSLRVLKVPRAQVHAERFSLA